MDVYLTHTDDVTMSLADRAQFAADRNADFLFSIHYNASMDHDLFGSEVWISSVQPYNAYGYQFGWEQMQQMQAMQRKIDALQDEINEMETSASSGGGAVTVVVTGKKEIKDIQIKPEVVDPDDIEMLQDLIMVAANEALRQMEEISSNEMNKLTAGLGIPGL